MKLPIRRMMAPLAALALTSGFAGAAAVVTPSAAHAAPVHTALRAGPPPPSTGKFQDATWLDHDPGSDTISNYSTTGDLYADDASGGDSYTLTYVSSGGYYCIYDSTQSAYVAAYSPSGIMKPDAGACGTNEEWGITCADDLGDFYLYVKAGPLAGDDASTYSSTNSYMYVGIASDYIDFPGECGG